MEGSGIHYTLKIALIHLIKFFGLFIKIRPNSH